MTFPHIDSSVLHSRPDAFTSHTSTLSGLATIRDVDPASVKEDKRNVPRIGVGVRA